MRYEIVLAPEALQDLKQLPAHERAEVMEAIEEHLRHKPKTSSKSSIKRLRALSKPQFRLRVGDLRVFYDVVETQVQVIAIVLKSGAAGWLEKVGK